MAEPALVSSRFRDLVAQVQSCTACAQMYHAHVLSDRNGPVPAPVMFIGEAVGRLGGARTGIPMTRDATGRRFQSLLALAGIDRTKVFITNAVLCNPLSQGKNRRPTGKEIMNCSGFLRAQLELVDPLFVVTLGEVALRALETIAGHRLRLRDCVGTAIPWHGRILVPLYHPGPRAVLHRPLAQQDDDWRRLGTLLTSQIPELACPTAGSHVARTL